MHEQLIKIREIVRKMRSDLTQVGGFDNELMSVPAGGLRSYIEKLEAVLVEKPSVKQESVEQINAMITFKRARNCRSCANSDSGGMPAESVCISCVATIDGRGSNYIGVNWRSIDELGF